MRYVSGLRLGVLLFVFLSASSASASQESPQTFTFQGELLNSAGTAPASGTIGFTFDIYDPSAHCLLYEESQSGVDLSSSQGLFSIAIGSPTSGTGSSKRTSNDPGLSMAQVFANSGAQTRASGSANCTAGYTPSPGDTRDLRVTIIPQSGPSITLSPDQLIDSAPQANVAETLQGVGPTGFVQISGNTGAYTAAKAGLDALLGTGTSGVVDASAYHNHDGRYVQIGTTPQNVGSGGWYTSGVGGTGVSAAPTGTQFEVMSSGTTTVGEIIKAGASQTGDLLDIESNSGTVLASVNSSGQMSLNDGLQLAAGTYLGLGTFASPPGSCSTAGQIWYSGGSVQYCNGSAVETLGTSGAGLQSLNGQTGNTQTFGAPTTAGTSFGFSSASNVHTLNIPMAATATVTAGLIANTDYTNFSGKVGGGASLSHAGALTQVSGSGTVTEAGGLSFGQSADITNLILTAGSSQSTTDLEDWKSSGGASTLYSLNSSGTPTANTDLATKNYVATAISGVGSSYVPLGGGTMTGPLVIPANDLTVGTSQLVLSGGYVGVGTTSPASLLNVGNGTPTTAANGIQFGTDTSATLYRSGTGMISTGGSFTVNSTVYTAGVNVGGNNGVYNPTGIAQGQILFSGSNPSTGAIDFDVNSTSQLHVSNGAVGIGTTAPSVALSVVGTTANGSSWGLGASDRVVTSITSTPTASGTNYLLLNNGNGASNMSNNLAFASNGTAKWVIGNDYQDNGSQNMTIQDIAAGKVRLLIDSSGNVGIGTTSPGATLEIDGASGTTLKIVDGNQGANKVLTSNSSGVASWQTPTSSMVYPGAGIPNSTGSAWGTPYTTSGSGTVLALNNSPSFTTPVLGVATATTVNGLSLTSNTTGFAVAGGTTSKTLTVSNSLTLSGTDGSTLNVGSGGTLGSAAYTASTAFAPAYTTSSVLKGNGSGGFTAAVAGTDYQAALTNPLTYSGSLTSGHLAIFNGSNQIVDGGSAPTGSQWTTGSGLIYYNGNVGIGTTSPQAKLDVAGSYAINGNVVFSLPDSDTSSIAVGLNALTSQSATNAANVAVGDGALKTQSSGTDNIAVGAAAGYKDTGSSNIFLGYYAGYNETGSNYFYLNNVAESSNANERAHSLMWGTFSGSATSLTGQQLVINGNVGIGTTSPAGTLDVEGSGAQICLNGNCVSSLSGGGSSQWTTSGSNIYYNTGSIGIGTSTPSSALEVSGGSIVSDSVSNTVAYINFGAGNAQLSSTTASTINICGMKDGGTYTLALTAIAPSTTVTVVAYPTYVNSTSCSGTPIQVDLGGGSETFTAGGNTNLLSFVYFQHRGANGTAYGAPAQGYNY